MKLNDHLLRIWTDLMSLVLPLLVVLAVLLTWPPVVQFVLTAFLGVSALGTRFALGRASRRR